MGRGVIRIALLLGVMVVVTGCPEVPDVVDYVCVSDELISMSEGGGVDTVCMCAEEQYDRWRLSNVESVGDEWEIRLFDPTVSDEELAEAQKTRPYIREVDSLRFENRWYRVYIPEAERRCVVVECDSNSDKGRRSLEIKLVTGDGRIGWITVKQSKREGEVK